MSTGSYEVDVLQGEGELQILSGSLAIHNKSEGSNIGTLRLSGGTLRGSAQLSVTNTFRAEGRSIESEGETVIGVKAEGRVEPIEAEGPGLRVAQKSSLVVKGSLMVAGAAGKLNVLEGALLEVENGGSLVVGGPEGQLTIKESADFVNLASVTTNAPSGQTNLIEHASLLNEGSYVLTAPKGGLVAADNASIENTSSLKIEGSEGEIRLEETTLVNTKALRIEAADGRLRGSKGVTGPRSDRLIKAGSASYEYDPAGNPIKTPGSTNAFDEASQLETGTGVGYEYDSLGERIKAAPTEGPATTYSYDQAGGLIAIKRAKAGEVPVSMKLSPTTAAA